MTNAFTATASTDAPQDYGVLNEGIQAAREFFASINDAINFGAFIDASAEALQTRRAEWQRHQDARAADTAYRVPREFHAYPETGDYELLGNYRYEPLDKGNGRFFGGEPASFEQQQLAHIPVMKDPQYHSCTMFSFYAVLKHKEDGSDIMRFNFVPRGAPAASRPEISREFDLSNPRDIETMQTAFGKFWRQVAGGVGTDIQAVRLAAFFNSPNGALGCLMEELKKPDQAPALRRQGPSTDLNAG